MDKVGKYILIGIGATFAGIIITVAAVFMMSNYFIGEQLDRVDKTATTVKESVEVVVEKGDQATEKVTGFIDAVKERFKDNADE